MLIGTKSANYHVVASLEKGMFTLKFHKDHMLEKAEMSE